MEIQFNNFTDSKYEKPLDQVKIVGRANLYSIGLITFNVPADRLWIYTRVPPSKINNQTTQRLNEILLKHFEESLLNRIFS